MKVLKSILLILCFLIASQPVFAKPSPHAQNNIAVFKTDYTEADERAARSLFEIESAIKNNKQVQYKKLFQSASKNFSKSQLFSKHLKDLNKLRRQTKCKIRCHSFKYGNLDAIDMYFADLDKRFCKTLGSSDKDKNKKLKKISTSETEKFMAMMKISSKTLKDENVRQVLNYYRSHKDEISTRAFKRAIYLGKELRYGKKYDLSDDIFKMATFIGAREDVEDAYFELLWNDIVRDDFKTAQKKIEKFNLIEKFTSFSSRLKFWIAYTAKQNKDLPFARHLYQEIVDHSPLSFYSIIALKELKTIDVPQAKKQYFSKLSNVQKTFKTYQKHYQKSYLDSLRLTRLMLDLGRVSIAEDEIDLAFNKKRHQIFKKNIYRGQLTGEEIDQVLVQNFADMMTESGHHLQTFKLIIGALGNRSYSLDKRTLEYLFPIRYKDEVARFAGDLDPLFVLSLIRQESAFNTRAISSVGARGLMQLMPSTAKQFSKRVSKKDLKDPSKNIQIGVKYLTKLVKQNDGDMVTTLASYNAGPYKVKRWKKTVLPATDNPLITIESIPFEETRLYVQLIYRNLFFYNFLEDNVSFNTPLEKSFSVSLRR